MSSRLSAFVSVLICAAGVGLAGCLEGPATDRTPALVPVAQVKTITIDNTRNAFDLVVYEGNKLLGTVSSQLRASFQVSSDDIHINAGARQLIVRVTGTTYQVAER